MIRNTFKWTAIGTVLIGASIASIAYAVGVPKPPAIRTQDVGRVGWAPLFANRSWLDRFKTQQFAGWMPDASGFLVAAPHRFFGRRLHVLTRPGGELRLIEQIPDNATIVHSEPGADYLIAEWDEGGDEQYRLFRWDLGDRAPEPITPAGERTHFGAAEPDGPRIAYTSNRRNGTDFDVYVVDPHDPTSDRLVAELEGAWTVHGWSPTSSQLLLTHSQSNREASVSLVDVETGQLHDLPLPAAHYVSLRWSRDGGSLYYGSDRETEFAHLRRYDFESSEEVVLSESVEWDVSSIQEPIDASFLLVAFNEGGVDRYYVTDALGHEFDRLSVPLPGLISVSLHPTQSRFLVNHTDAHGVGRAYLYDREDETTELWAGAEPRLAEGRNASLPAATLVHYPTFDEVNGERRQIPAFVYPGTGPGPHPVTISVHGGPEAQARLSAAWGAAQRRGVTVITPNVRGSTGYGRTYEKLDNGILREDAVRDIGALLDWIETNPELDANRVSIVGGSYGGYMVLASLVHHGDRIQCGIDRVGISNFVTFLENTADYRRDLRRAEYGDERIPEMRAFLESISPLNHADRISSQLMVVQGANDPRVPVTEALQLVKKVRQQGQAASYIEAANEGHGFKKPWNVFYTYVAEQELLGECLSL